MGQTLASLGGFSLPEFAEPIRPAMEFFFPPDEMPTLGMGQIARSGAKLGAKALSDVDVDKLLEEWRRAQHITEELRAKIGKVLKDTAEGRPLSHRRPPVGTKLFRGQESDIVDVGPRSFSTDEPYVDLFGDHIFRTRVGPRTRAIMVPRRGVDEGEVIVDVDSTARGLSRPIRSRTD
jgi:hypothetical protein